MGNTESSVADVTVSEDRKWFSLVSGTFYQTKHIVSIQLVCSDYNSPNDENSHLLIKVRSACSAPCDKLETNSMTREKATRTLFLFMGPISTPDSVIIKKPPTEIKSSTPGE